MFSTETDFMVQFHGPDEHDDGWSFGTSSAFMPTDEVDNMTWLDHTSFYSSDTLNPNFQYFSQENSNSSDNNAIAFPTSTHENYHLNYSNHISKSTDFCMMDNKINSSPVPDFVDEIMESILCLKEEMSGDQVLNAGQPAANADPVKELQLKRKFNMPELHTADTSESPKKKSRRNATKCKKNQKLTVNCDDEEETNNVGPNGQSSSCYSSEDDSNASQELNGGANSDSKGSAPLNSKGKTRASRGSATDPQSLYARVKNFPLACIK
ncbi:hypothetical protein F0562_035819 [Nyssa sinensis]|uniref:Uncharacterized protein n=1 Tax=Nyssa sinensis TaxID=561372 RepID=A0A5J5ADY0_9ASTE|nr:hypothetical protein F0562_035819 [Nyssa sinensis]